MNTGVEPAAIVQWPVVRAGEGRIKQRGGSFCDSPASPGGHADEDVQCADWVVR